MKKRILYLSSFILIVLGVCIFIDQALFKPTEINSFIATKVYSSPANKAFTDDNFYKCVVDAYNSENKTSLPYTTNLSDSQLGSIKKLSCNGYYKSDEEKIKNTNGLEKLTALTYLSVGGNQLTELDVSNNTALTYLNVTTNQLTSLNVSSNTALTYLSVSKNHLTELDVSNNIALIDLEAAGNQLTELDVSKNTALTYLYVSENNLTSLDFSKNVALKKLYVSENNLTSLDVSRNTALTYLSVSKNHLTELDVSNNIALTYLSVNANQLTSLNVSNNTALTYLSVSKNQLTGLDVSKNTTLQELYVGLNQLIELDINNNTSLTQLQLDCNQLTELDVSKNTALTYLYVSENNLTSLDFSKNVALKKLYVSENNLTSLDVSRNTALTYLSVSKNHLTELDVSKNTALTYLSVTTNQLTELDVSKNTALIDLYVHNNTFVTNIIIYKGGINVDNDNRFVKLPEGKTSTLTSLKSDDNDVNIDDNNININKIGEYVVTADYKHDIQNNFNTYSGTYNIKVIEITSDKYVIDEEDSYIYTGTDTDNNTILSNINLDSECTKVIENNELIIKYKDEVLKKFKVINISSSKYDLSKEYIYDNNFNKDNINVTNGTSEVVDNELLIKYNDEVLDKYKIISISSSKYDLNKEYIYVGTGDIDLDSIKVVNGSYEVVNNELILKYGEEVLDRYKIVSISSSKYDLSKEYIYDNNFNKDNINITNGTSEVVNNELLIKYNDEVLDRYKIVSISSTKYDLSKEYIYDNSFNKDNINVINGTSEVLNNELIIKYNGDVLDKYKIVSISSSKYDLNKEYIYVGTGDIDLDSIKVINGTIELVDNELILKYGGEVLDRYKIIGIKFGELKVNIDLVVITENISYDMFISNITTNGVTYKIFNGEEEVTSGNISKGMVVKVYYNDEEVYTYNITNEYLEFIDPLEVVDETKRIYNVKLNTSVNDLLSKINTSGTIIVRNNKNEVISGNALVGTGTKVIIKLSSGTKEYTLVIKGDVTGTGTSSVSDVAKLYQYLKKKINMEDYFIEAGNVVNTDNEIGINDVAKLYQFIKGKLNSLE